MKERWHPTEEAISKRETSPLNYCQYMTNIDFSSQLWFDIWSCLLLVINGVIHFSFLFWELWWGAALARRGRTFGTKDGILSLHGHGLSEVKCISKYQGMRMSSVFPTQTNLLLCATESTLAVKYCFNINLFLTLNMQHIHSAAFPFPALRLSVTHTHTQPLLSVHTASVWNFFKFRPSLCSSHFGHYS